MVAAWIRAETGVGPSIASGSQTCSGNWALLPMAPAKSSSAMIVIRVGSSSPIRAIDLADVERAQADEDQHDPEDEADVADAVDDERLLGGQRRRALAVPEADQQVAAQADQLPRDEHDQEAVRQDQQEHREHEQVEVGEEPPVARVVAHVADRVDVDQQPDRGHHDQQAGGQVVDEEAGVDREVAGRDPLEQPDVEAALPERRLSGQRGIRGAHRDQPRDEDGQHRDPVRLLAQPPPDQRGQQKPPSGSPAISGTSVSQLIGA